MADRHESRCFRLYIVITGILITSLIFSCAHNKDWANRIDWKEVDRDSIPTQEDYHDAGAVILLDEAKMEILGDEKLPMSVFEHHRIVKMLNPRGQKFASIAIPYSAQSEVEKIRARTISPDGKITVLDKKDIFDITFYPNFVFYSDRRAKLFPLPAIEDGSLIEYRYQLRVESRTLWHSWGFQNDVPTLLSRFTLIKPTEWDLNYRMYGMKLEPRERENPVGSKSTHIWEARDIPAQKFEFGMPPSKESLIWLALAPVGIETWDDVAFWYYDLSEPRMKPGTHVKDLALSLTEGIEDNYDKLRAVYEWVRDHIRYIAVAIGIGSFQPHPVEKIFTNRYGDCKDMTTLLCSLAREAGIDAHQVLVSTWLNGVPDTTLPSPLHFNHAIAYCPSMEIWMDATEKGCLFNRLPWYDQGLPVLMVGDEGKANLIVTPFSSPDSNQTVLDWRVNLTSTGAAEIHGQTMMRGSVACNLRENLITLSNDDQKKWIELYLSTRCSGVKLDTFRISGIQPVSDPLIIDFNFHTSTFAVSRSREMSFSPGAISAFDLPDYFRSQTRRHPIRFLSGITNELNLRVNLPEGWELDEAVLCDSLSSPFGTAYWHWIADSTQFSANAKFTLTGHEISSEQYPEFQEYLDNVRRRDLTQIVLKKSDEN